VNEPTEAILIPSKGELRCEGRDGPGVYQYVLRKEPASPFFPVGNARFPRWTCLVYDDADSTHGRVHAFQADAVQVESDLLIQNEMHRTGERGGEHSAKGMPDAVIDLFHRARMRKPRSAWNRRFVRLTLTWCGSGSSRKAARRTMSARSDTPMCPAQLSQIRQEQGGHDIARRGLAERTPRSRPRGEALCGRITRRLSIS
jgi:hypothetical protein